MKAFTFSLSLMTNIGFVPKQLAEVFRNQYVWILRNGLTELKHLGNSKTGKATIEKFFNFHKIR